MIIGYDTRFLLTALLVPSLEVIAGAGIPVHARQ